MGVKGNKKADKAAKIAAEARHLRMPRAIYLSGSRWINSRGKEVEGGKELVPNQTHEQLPYTVNLV